MGKITNKLSAMWAIIMGRPVAYRLDLRTNGKPVLIINEKKTVVYECLIKPWDEDEPEGDRIIFGGSISCLR